MDYLYMLIKEIAMSTMQHPYRLQSGKMVEFGCPTCINDLERRIDDGRYYRDECDRRSDAREHYNGILKVLRRELRSAHKINEMR